MSARHSLSVARFGFDRRLRNRERVSAGGAWGVGLRRLRFESLESRRLLAVAPWTAGAVLPIATSAAAAVDFNSTLYLFGGFHGAQAASSVYQLAPTDSMWTTASSLNQAQAAGGVGETGYYPSNGGDGATSDIFSYGGISQGQASASVSNYGSESTFAAMSTPRAFFAYATDPGDTGNSATQYLYAIGGLNAANQTLSSVERYDAAANAWTTVAPLPQALSHTTAADDGVGHIFVFGGEDSSGTPVATVYRYTVATNTWDTAAAMPAALSDASALYAAYGLIYVIGGKSAQGAVDTVWDYNPVLDSWTADAPLPAADYDAATAIDANGNLNVIGGADSSGAPVTNVWTTPVGQPPQGLPAYPTLQFPVSADIYNFFTYDGAQHAATAFAYGTDGVTPVAGSFTYTYNGSSTPPVNAGTYQVIAHFVSADSGYVDAYVAGQLVIQPAFVTFTNITGAGTFPYDAQPHPVAATVVGINGATPSGMLSYTYNGSSSPPVAPGTYNVVITFNSSDPNYNTWSDPAPYSGNTITVTIPDPTIPTNFVSTALSTTSLTLSWNAAWETDVNLTPASSYTITARTWHPGTHSPRGSGGTPGYWVYSTVASGITSTSYTISGLAAGSVHSYALNSVNGSGAASPQTAYISAPTAVAPAFSYVNPGALVSGLSPVAEAETTSTYTLVYSGVPAPSVSMTNGPPTMTFNPATNVITYSPADSEAGYVTATFQATNVAGSVTTNLTFHVLAHPILSIIGGSFTFDGQTHSATAVAYARDGVTPLPGTITFTYSPVQYPTAQSTAPYAEAGQYVATATFVSGDPNYGGATGTASLVINPAAPTIVIDGLYGYTGSPQAATAVANGIDGVTPIGGDFQFTYDGSTTRPTAPGSYLVVANFTAAAEPYSTIYDYSNATATRTVVILPNSAVTVQSGTVQGGIGGAVSLIKSGAGIATLSGPNGYTGGTFVDGGTLIVNDPTALPDGGAIGVGSDAVFLAAAESASAAAPTANSSMVAGATVRPSVAATVRFSPAAAISPSTIVPVEPSANVYDQALLALLATDRPGVRLRMAAASLIDSPLSIAGVAGLNSDGTVDRGREVALLSQLSFLE